MKKKMTLFWYFKNLRFTLVNLLDISYNVYIFIFVSKFNIIIAWMYVVGVYLLRYLFPSHLLETYRRRRNPIVFDCAVLTSNLYPLRVGRQVA